MGSYQKKTWQDEITDAANRAQTAGEKKVREILEFVASSKEKDLRLVGEPLKGIPFELLRELEEIQKQVHFHWEMFDHIPEQRIIKGRKQLVNVLVYTQKPYLKNILLENRDQKYLWGLVQKLQDRDWVGALRECPACGNFLLSTAAWEVRYCSKKCKGKHKARERRKKEREERQITIRRELETFACPGSAGEEVTLDECLQRRELYGKYTCPSCPHFKKQ